MKYIRTKDGIFEIQWFESNDCFIEKKNHEIISCELEDKQADTIEELCDLFIVRTLTCKYSYLVFSKYEDVKNTCLGDRDLFGAIWTDKGLIYVAKMNEEGVLCLI